MDSLDYYKIVMPELFEKEAVEYAERTKTEKEIEVLNTVHDWGQESLSPNERRLFEGIQDRKEAREQGFKDGAEFGYNKANEWHYVKDGDLPKDENDVLVLLIDKTVQVDYYFPKIGWNVSVNNAVIAWKEIVLPELPKEKVDE